MRNKVIYAGWTFTDSDAANGSLAKSQDLTAASLSADSISVEVLCSDPTIMRFTLNAPMIYFYRERQKGIYYLQSVTRVSPNHYVLSGLSALGLLAAMPHLGGLYTGQTVREVVEEVCGSVPVLVKARLADIQLYGWLPSADPPQKSARDNLSQVLFAIGGYLGTDLNGVLRVESLWDGAASAIPAARIYCDGVGVEYAAEISSITVTEHQYTALDSTETQELFSGTTQDGDIITFDEPMHTLSATGFSVLASGANWAKLSAGTGVLIGKPYIHNTRQVTEPVVDGVAENVKSVSDATLVSFANSAAVAKRLAAYYRCRETISAGIVAGSEKPGHVVSIYHPYDRRMVNACIISQDITMSATLKADTKALVGFLPPQPGESQYYNTVEMLTSDGNWTVPDGVTSIRVVLIGGGTGGWSGLPGQVPENAEVEEYIAGDDISRWIPETAGGAGGDPGEGGTPGKVHVESLTVTPGQSIAVHIGAGGEGGAPGETSNAGVAGGATTFGDLSSDSGSVPENGYHDDVTGSTYALAGAAGVKGGNGNGKGQDGSPVTVDGVTYVPGKNSAVDKETLVERSSYTLGAYACGSYGGGAAYGANGPDGLDGTGDDALHQGIAIIERSAGWTITAKGASGAGGANAVAFPQASVRGSGGRGGNGGGGAGSGGEGAYSKDGTVGTTVKYALLQPTRLPGGRGSKGSQGADGCVLVYYQAFGGAGCKPLVDKSSKWFLDQLGRRLIV